MYFPRLVLVTSLTLASTGCLGASDPLAFDELPAPRLETLDPGGGVGPNGLTPDAFHASELKLITATHSALQDGTQFSAQLIATGILASSEGKGTLRYAVGCALREGNSIFDSNDGNKAYDGLGLLSTASSWAVSTAGLPADARKDLFACMAARLNPSGQTVWILLTGAAVPDHQIDQSAYTFDEAVWIAKFPTSSPMEVHVWPLEDLENSCERGAEAALQTRFCATGLASCGLVVRNDLSTACTLSSAGFYTCDGQRAIKTQLKPQDVSKIHGGCGI